MLKSLTKPSDLTTGTWTATLPPRDGSLDDDTSTVSGQREKDDEEEEQGEDEE